MRVKKDELTAELPPTHLQSPGSGSWDRVPCCRASAPFPHCWPAGDPETSSASSAVTFKFFYNAVRKENRRVLQDSRICNHYILNQYCGAGAEAGGSVIKLTPEPEP
jgi:hypothetical protein